LLFPKPPDTSSLVFSIEDIWEHTDSFQTLICNRQNTDISIKVDSHYLKFWAKDLAYTCSQISCFLPMKKREVIEVLINSENTLLIEGKVHSFIEIDSLFQLMYLNPDRNQDYVTNPKHSAVSVKWDINASKPFVKEVIKELAFAYANCIARQYPNTTGAALCDSVSLHKEQLMKNFPFNLQLHFGRNLTLGGRIPPPPPPQL
jgi:hypothetical protein